MISKLSIFSIIVVLTGLIFCDRVAAGPLMNAEQFQEKAIEQVLSNPKNQGYKSKERYIKTGNTPIPKRTVQDTGKTEESLVNVDSQSVVNVK